MTGDPPTQPFDIEELRARFDTFSSLRAALQTVLICSAVASGLELTVDGEPVGLDGLPALVHWDCEEEYPCVFSPDQHELTPDLVADLDRMRFDLTRTPSGVSFAALLDYLHPRVPKILRMANALVDLERTLRSLYPAVIEEEPDLLFF